MTVAKVFLDTNIVLRATITQFPLHEQVREFVNNYIVGETELWINRQVVREYFNQVTRPQIFMNPMKPEQIQPQYEVMCTMFKIADETEAVTAQLIILLQEYPTAGKQVHDANIVATMLAYDINTLLTMNIDDFKRFEDKITLISP
jgi:predicted nucleic acid-binding protein